MDHRILANITPEIIGMATNDIHLITPDSKVDTNYLINGLNNYIFNEPIIKTLHNIRINKNKKTFSNMNDIAEFPINEPVYLYKKIEKNSMEIFDHIIKFRIPKNGDLIESIIINNYKSIKISTGDNTCVLFHSYELGEKQQYELYDSAEGKRIIEGFLLSDHNIPIRSVEFNELQIEIEFHDAVDDNIGFIYVICDKNLMTLMTNTLFELDTQKDKFIIFGYGCVADHIIGGKSPELQKIFDQAHIESKKRKQINYL